MPVKFGRLPKIKGSGRRGSGIWPGHQAEAKAVREWALKDPEEYGRIAEGMKMHAASRVASLINKGEADDFKPDEHGRYEAKTRRADGEAGEQGLYDLWVRYVPSPVKVGRRRTSKAS